MTYDFIVIGAGVHGSANSYFLTQSGAKVLLLEAGEIASGASGGVGFRGVRANGRDLRELPLMAIAYDMWPEINSLLTISPGYHRTGGLELIGPEIFADASLLDELETKVRVQSSFGIETRLIDRAELNRLEPGASDSVAGAIFCPSDGVGDHTGVTRGFAAAAKSLGADVHENTPVTAISSDSSVCAVTTEAGEVHHAKKVLVTANSYSRTLLRDSFGIDLPITRFNPQMTPVRTQSNFTFAHLIGHYSLPFAAKTIADGQVMLSGGRTGRWDYASDEGHTRTATAELSVTDAATLYPAFRDAEIVSTDASRPESKAVDGIPIIDAVPGAPNVYFATGWSGHGFAISPAAASLISRWLTTGAKPPELAPFSLDRFTAELTARSLPMSA